MAHPRTFSIWESLRFFSLLELKPAALAEADVVVLSPHLQR